MMKRTMTMQVLGVVLCALVAVRASEPPAASSFAPFEEWKRAVTSGNEAALKNLYIQNPPARLLLGKSQTIPLDTECQFWTNLKSYGISDVNPKVLSIETANRQTQLVLRIDARAGDKKIVASMAQLWVQQLDGWHLAISQRSDFGLDAPRTLPEPAKPNPTLYPPIGDAHADLQAALTRAAKEHKRVLVVFGANWCYDCHVLDSTFRSTAFKPLVDGNYVVVHINIGDEGHDNNDIAAQFGIPLDRGVPNIAIVAADGKTVVARQSDFTATSRIGPSDVRAFLERWKPHKAT